MISKEKILTKGNINSLIIAVIICANAISLIFPIDNIIVLIMCIAALIFLINNNFKLHISIKKIVLIMCIMLYFLVSFLLKQNNNNTILFLMYFIVFGIIPIIIIKKEIEIKKIYICIVYLSILIIPYILTQNFFINSTIESGNLMGLSYALLPGILASSYCILNCEFSKKQKIISAIIFIIYTLVYINIASRGAVLSVVAYYLGLFLIKVYEKKLKSILYIIIVFLTVALCIINYQKILTVLQEGLELINIDFKAIDKMERLMEDEDINFLNGRDVIYEIAINEIKEHPIIGNGIATFYDLYGGHPHNLFIQIFYETGIIPFLFSLILIIKILYELLNSKNKELKEFIIFLVSASLVQLMFSSTFWINQNFWLLVGYI